MSFDSKKATKAQLIERVQYLDETNNWYSFAVDLLTQMSDIYGDADNIRDVQNILATTRNYIERLFKFDAVAFFLIEEENSEFELSQCEPSSKESIISKKINALIDTGEFAWALNQNRAVSFNLDSGHSLVLHVISSKTRLRGMFVGLAAGNSDVVNYNEGSLSLLSVVLYNTGYALESAALYAMIHEHNIHLEETVEKRTNELDHQCKHDSLTDLPNRLLFMDRLEHAIHRALKTKDIVAVMLFDLDRFKIINDTLGHHFGDELLLQIAERLSDILTEHSERLCLRHDSDITLARFGGDEFAILIADASNMDDIIQVANEVCVLLQNPFQLEEKEIFITCSMGVGIYPNDAKDPHDLIKLCDVAMYHAKESSGNQYQFYSDEINNISSAYLHLGNKLHQALDKNEFKLYYQPQISLKTGKIIGAEALIRWFCDDKMVPPDQFIPIAEDTGQILSIGEWVIEMAAEQAAIWLNTGLDIQVAVNLSAKQFMQEDLISKLDKILSSAGVPNKYIELEITEGTIIQDVSKTINLLNQMHDMGHPLSIDDFGTGYSSLAYLKKLPVDSLKIDKSFVLDLHTNKDDKAIVRSVVALSHSLNLEVVAEGIETQAHVDFLTSLDCEVGQGFFFSKPVPADEFTELFNKRSPNK